MTDNEGTQRRAQTEQDETILVIGMIGIRAGVPRQVGPAVGTALIGNQSLQAGGIATVECCEHQCRGRKVTLENWTILFLYSHVLQRDLGRLNIAHARRPSRLPVVLGAGEVAAVLSRMSAVPRLVASVLYGGGLRLLEGLTLRVKDLDFAGQQMIYTHVLTGGNLGVRSPFDEIAADLLASETRGE